MDNVKQWRPWYKMKVSHAYLPYWSYIYSSGQIEHNEILTFKLKVQINQPQN